jgi:hypothetical protein
MALPPQHVLAARLGWRRRQAPTSSLCARAQVRAQHRARPLQVCRCLARRQLLAGRVRRWAWRPGALAPWHPPAPPARCACLQPTRHSTAPHRAASCRTQRPRPLLPGAGGSSLQRAAQRAKQELTALCSARPSEADAWLSADQVAQVARHLAGGVLQHYALYCAVYRRQQEHVQHVAHLLVGRLPAAALGAGLCGCWCCWCRRRAAARTSSRLAAQ